MPLLLGLLVLLLPVSAFAHRASDSYLTLTLEAAAVRGEWHVALRDLDQAVALDADGDGRLLWGELRRKRAAVIAYLEGGLKVESGGVSCAMRPTDYLVDDHSDGAYSVLRFDLDCPGLGGELVLAYSLLFDLDPQHRGLLRVVDGPRTHAAVLGPSDPSLRIELGRPDRVRTLVQYVREGVWHIWIGLDHILFLLTLLLPAVLMRQDGRWRGAQGLGAATLEVVKVVTAFTLAHSITLTAAALGLVELPSRWVESAIAASVVLAALNNLYPVVERRRWALAFGFGLVHGLGFASVLADLGLPGDARVLALLGFNLGVEAGQLAIVAALVPLAFAVRGSLWYRRLGLQGGSAAIAALAAVWLVERSMSIALFSGGPSP